MVRGGMPALWDFNSLGNSLASLCFSGTYAMTRRNLKFGILLLIFLSRSFSTLVSQSTGKLCIQMLLGDEITLCNWTLTILINHLDLCAKQWNVHYVIGDFFPAFLSQTSIYNYFNIEYVGWVKLFTALFILMQSFSFTCECKLKGKRYQCEQESHKIVEELPVHLCCTF